jgi:hypothetical protein
MTMATITAASKLLGSVSRMPIRPMAMAITTPMPPPRGVATWCERRCPG